MLSILEVCVRISIAFFVWTPVPFKFDPLYLTYDNSGAVLSSRIVAKFNCHFALFFLVSPSMFPLVDDVWCVLLVSLGLVYSWVTDSEL